MDNNNLMGEENKQLNQVPIQQAVNVEDMQEQYRPQELDITQFTEEQRHYTTNRSKRQIREDNIRIETLETTGFHSVEEKMRTRTQKMENNSELLLRDKKWYRLFDSESEEMKHVKSSVAYLNNVLSGPVPRLATGAINAQQMKKDVMSAYITAFHACDKYLKSHKLKGKHSTGERRKQKVKQMISTIGKDQKLFEVAVDNALGMLQGTQSIQHPRELLERTRAQEAKIARFMTEGNSSDVYRVKIKGLDKLKEKRKDETDEEHLKRLKRYQLTEESLYVKKDEKLLNEDFDGYLKRRIATLTHSKEKRQQIMDMLKQPDMVETLREFSLKETERAESLAGDKKITEEEAAKRKEAVAFNEADPESLYRIYGVMKEDEIALKDRKIEQKIKKLKNAKTAEEVNAIDQFVIDTNKEIFDIRNAREEYRLEGKVKDTDYTFALRILGAIKNKVDAAGDNKKAVTEKYLKLFAHDFDGFFAGLADYNNQIERLNGDKDGLRAVIAGIKGQYNNDPEKIPAGVKIVLKSFESALEGELKTMTELEWFKDHLDMFGLKENDDVYTIIKELAEQDERGISKLMQRSMGKEAELFGQQAERSGLTNSEALAANNTASSRIAGMAGFEDVITTSYKGLLSYRELGKEQESYELVTMSQEAPGEEMLSLVQEAEMMRKNLGLEKSPIHYTTKALRQLNRLQTFDTLTLQTDRHWRNFKCIADRTTDENGNPIILIRSVKAYDHDQSFGPKSLDQYFKDVKDPKTGQISTKREGFLPPLMMTVDKKSTMYKYVNRTKEGGKLEGNFLDQIGMPTYRTEVMRKAANSDYKQRKKEKPEVKKKQTLYEFETREILYNGYDFMTFGNKLKERINEINPGKEQIVEQFFESYQSLVQLMFKNVNLYDPDNTGDEIELKDGSQIVDNKEHRDALIAIKKVRLRDQMIQEKYDEDTIKEKEKLCDDSYASRKDALKLFKKVYDLYRQLDFVHVEKPGIPLFEKKIKDSFYYASEKGILHGYTDYALQAFFHMIKGYFSDGAENKVAMEELLKEEDEAKKIELHDKVHDVGVDGHKPSAEEVEAIVKKGMDEYKSPTIRVPSMLHMDKKAFDSIKHMYDNWDAETIHYLIDLGWTQEKYDALKTRMEEIIRTKEDAEKILNKWADEQNLPQDHISRKFLLEEDEWDKITDIKQIALDPGNSYYSIEDSGFMASQLEYGQFVDVNEEEEIRKKAEQERSVERVKKVGSIGDEYHSMVDGAIVNMTDEEIAQRQEAYSRGLVEQSVQQLAEDKRAKFTSENVVVDVTEEMIRKDAWDLTNKLDDAYNKVLDKDITTLSFAGDANFAQNYGEFNEYYSSMIRLDTLVKGVLRANLSEEFRREYICKVRAKIEVLKPLAEYLKLRYDVMSHPSYVKFREEGLDMYSDEDLEQMEKEAQSEEDRTFATALLKLRRSDYRPKDTSEQENKLYEQFKKAEDEAQDAYDMDHAKRVEERKKEKQRNKEEMEKLSSEEQAKLMAEFFVAASKVIKEEDKKDGEDQGQN